MLLIPCPWCGARDHTEFTYGGDAKAAAARPALELPLSAWHEHVYLRDNPRGRHLELWHHTASCRRWIAVERDTLTHAITASADAGRGPGGGTG
ncbi:MAG TPA: sarcosine oxidase subunit delta [Alphaproteobacteria bacterium]|nr:sarcosine oxidase subunit delta [Alphaproteobacteria bacterium]